MRGSVKLVDMVLHEVTRNQTPTSGKLAKWAAAMGLPVLPTKTFAHVKHAGVGSGNTNKNNLGELAIQETMNDFALMVPPKVSVFLFEDHKIAHASFLLPDACQKISIRAFLMFLEQKGWIAFASDIERRAIQAGRIFSQLRFPPE